MPIKGEPIVRHPARSAVEAGLEVHVVTGHEPDRIEAALAGIRVSSFTHNPDYGTGMGTSVAAGIEALPSSTDAAFIMLGDMPHIPASLLSEMVGVARKDDFEKTIVPIGKRGGEGGHMGNPILFPKHVFEDLATLTGDQGAKSLIKGNPDLIRSFETNEPGIFVDYDTLEAFPDAG